jgi:hypothetical protein
MQIREATMADVAASARVHGERWRTTYKGLLVRHEVHGWNERNLLGVCRHPMSRWG